MTVAYGEEVLESGVYCITNVITGKKYIGSSNCLRKRRTQHLCKLKSCKGSNTKLINAAKKYGYEAFVFDVIEYCEVDKLIEREQFHINYYDLKKDLYNTRAIAESNLGYKFTYKQRENLKLSLSKIDYSYRKGIPSWNKGTTGLMKNIWNKGLAGTGACKPNKGSFKKGVSSWNKGIVGRVRGSGSRGKEFKIVSPDFKLYIGINLDKFAKENNLNKGNIAAVSRGVIRSCRNWTKYKEGVEYKEVINWTSEEI